MQGLAQENEAIAEGDSSQVAGNLFCGQRWVIEGQGAWEGRGNGFGQVAAAGASRRHPAGQPGSSIVAPAHNCADLRTES